MSAPILKAEEAGWHADYTGEPDVGEPTANRVGDEHRVHVQREMATHYHQLCAPLRALPGLQLLRTPGAAFVGQSSKACCSLHGNFLQVHACERGMDVSLTL